MSWGFYFYPLNIVVLCIWRIIFNGKKNKRNFLFMACLQMFIVLAIRSSYVGVDSWTQYPYVFKEVSNFSFNELISRWTLLRQMSLRSWPAESGYSTLNWIFGGLLGLSYRTFIVFMSFIDVFCVYKYLSYNTDSPLLGASIMYRITLTNYFSGYRRCMSMNFFMLAFIQMEKKRYNRALILMCIAFTMHRSSLIMWIFLILSRIKITREIFLGIAIFTSCCLLIPSQYVLGSLSGIFAIFGKETYFSRELLIYNGGFYRAMGVLYIVMLFGIYFAVDFSILQTRNNNLLCWVFLFFVAFSPIDAAFPIISQEIGFYFRPSIFILFSNILARRKEYPHIRVIFWTIALLGILITWLISLQMLSKGHWSSNLSYRTIFQTRDGF